MNNGKPMTRLVRYSALALVGLTCFGLAAPGSEIFAAEPVKLSQVEMDAVSAAGSDPNIRSYDDAIGAGVAGLLQSGPSVFELRQGLMQTDAAVGDDPTPIMPEPKPDPLDPSPKIFAIQNPQRISGRATATACCGPSASVSTLVSGTIAGQTTTVRNGEVRMQNGVITSMSFLEIPLLAPLWGQLK